MQPEPVPSAAVQDLLHTLHLDTPLPPAPRHCDWPFFALSRQATLNEWNKTQQTAPMDSSMLLLEAEMLLRQSSYQKGNTRDVKRYGLGNAEKSDALGSIASSFAVEHTAAVRDATRREDRCIDKEDDEFVRECCGGMHEVQVYRKAVAPRETHQSMRLAAEYSFFSPFYHTAEVHSPVWRHASIKAPEESPVMHTENVAPRVQEHHKGSKEYKEIGRDRNLLEAGERTLSESEMRDAILCPEEARRLRHEPLRADDDTSASFYDRLDSIRLLHNETIEQLETAADLLSQERKWINMRCTVLYDRLEMIVQHRNAVLERLTEVHGGVLPEMWKQFTGEST